MILQVPSFVITAASPGALELLEPLAQRLVGRSLMDFIEGHPSGDMPLLAAGRITGYETVHVLKRNGQRRRLWISALPDIGPSQAVIAVMLKEDTGRVLVPWKSHDPSLAVIGSTDARLMVDLVSSEVSDSLGYRAEEVIGNSFLALIVPEDVTDVLLALAQMSEHEEGVTLRVGLVTASLAPMTCQLVLLPLTPSPSCAFAVLPEDSERPASARIVADLISRLGRGIRGAMTSEPAGFSPLRSETDLRHLTSRELEIVTRIMAGDRVSSIAKQLFLSEGTIRNHLSSVFGKVGVRSQQELIELLRARPAASGPR